MILHQKPLTILNRPPNMQTPKITLKLTNLINKIQSRQNFSVILSKTRKITNIGVDVEIFDLEGG